MGFSASFPFLLPHVGSSQFPYFCAVRRVQCFRVFCFHAEEKSISFSISLSRLLFFANLPVIPKIRTQIAGSAAMSRQDEDRMLYIDQNAAGQTSGQFQIKCRAGAIRRGAREHGRWRVDASALPSCRGVPRRLPAGLCRAWNGGCPPMPCGPSPLGPSRIRLRNLLQQWKGRATLARGICSSSGRWRVPQPGRTIFPVQARGTTSRSRCRSKETRT